MIRLSGRKNFSSTLLGSVVGSLCVKLTKDRLAKKKTKIHHVFLLMCMQDFIENVCQRGSLNLGLVLYRLNGERMGRRALTGKQKSSFFF